MRPGVTSLKEQVLLTLIHRSATTRYHRMFLPCQYCLHTKRIPGHIKQISSSHASFILKPTRQHSGRPTTFLLLLSVLHVLQVRPL
jgi:hypothetical protein